MSTTGTSITLRVTGMTCAGCVQHVDQALRRVPGVRDVNVHLLTETAVVQGEWNGAAAHEGLVRAVRAAGYDARVAPTAATVADAVPTDAEARERLRRHRQALVQAIGLALPILFLEHFRHAMWADTRMSQLLFRFTECVLLVMLMISPAGGPIIAGGLRAALRLTGNMDLLITLGVLTAAGASLVGSIIGDDGLIHFHAAAMILALVCVGRYLEQRARDRAGSAFAALARRAPRTALVRRGGELVSLPVEQIVLGDVVHVPAHAAIATDGEVIEGEAAVDERMMTGEPMPVSRAAGMSVRGGTQVTEGSLVYRATAVGKQAALGRILEMVSAAQASRTEAQRMADRVAAVFTPLVIAAALATWVGWWVAGGSAATAARAAIAVLVVACPCALGLATPTVVMVASGTAALRGILVRDAAMLEAMGRVDTIVWDKTGTLTSGEPEIEAIQTICDEAGEAAQGAHGEAAKGAHGHAARPTSQRELLRLSASVEQLSSHPLARALVRHARRQGLELVEPSAFESRPARGVRARVDGREVVVGSRGYLHQLGISSPADAAAGAQVWIAVDGRAAGWARFSDPVRPSSAPAVRRLSEMGLTHELLTGDEAAPAHAVAGALGISQVRAGAEPADKLAHVRERMSAGRRVAMVGDGVNDAAALAAANVGVAFASGAEAAGEAAGIHLVGSTPHLVADAVSLARAARRIMRQNLFWAFVYNILMIPLAATGRLPPAAAAAAMAISSLTVVVNALRLPRVLNREAPEP